MAVSPWLILRIERQPIERPEGYPGPPSYAWTLALGAPTPGEIHFGASGFTQKPRAEPVLSRIRASRLETGSAVPTKERDYSLLSATAPDPFIGPVTAGAAFLAALET